jgi:holo-[acyl-carrier protein] synthase
MPNKIGIDICQISRMKIDDTKFLARFLHPQELERLKTIQNPDVQRQFAAGRWAVKEAMYKAWNFPNAFSEILVSGDQEKPVVTEPQICRDFEISISHDGNFAIAVAILNRN